MSGQDALDLVLGKLDGVEQHGGYWMARCSAHEDARASLSVKQGTEQPVVLHCHAGCKTAAILDAIGLTLADISAPREQPALGEFRGDPIVATYDYTDEEGRLLFQVCRTAGKQFPQRRPDPSSRSGWTWKLGGTRRVLYRLPKVIEAVRNGQTIYMCEGEKDVHAVERAGGVATCNPMGAGKWRAEYSDFLAGASVVVISDADRAGREHAGEVAASLAGKASSVTITEPAAGKDASDHLAAGLVLGDLVPAESDTSDSGIAGASENPGPLTSDNDTSDSSDSGVSYELRDGAWLDGQQFPPLRYAIPGLMPAGLGIIAAPPKAGKSLLILDWLLAKASGGRALGALPAGAAADVLYLALEDGGRRLQARCRHLLAPGEQIPGRFRYILAVPPGQVLAVLADVLERHPQTALIVVDTLGRIMPLPLQGETTYQRDYRVGVALKRVADEHGLAIVVITHTRKAFADDFIDSISGTHGLAGAADTIIALTRGRGQGDAVMRVTGRDVIEADYAVTFHAGVWALDGGTLAEARANVTRRADQAALSGQSAEIIDFVRSHGPEGARTKQVTDKFGKDAAQYLRRHTEAGRLVKPKRGLYVVSEVSEVSETQVRDTAETDTPMFSVSEASEPGDDEAGQ